MTRILVPLLAVALAAGPALGQGFTRPMPTPPPVRDPATGQLVPWPGPVVPRFVPRPFPMFGVPWFGGLGYYSYGPPVAWYPPVYDYGPVFPQYQPPAQNGPPPIVPELPAEWTIEFPAAGDVTVNGVPATGDGAVRKLTSPPLKPAERYTFAVAARWTADGKRYEWDRTLTLGAGERSRSTVARGFLVGK